MAYRPPRPNEQVGAPLAPPVAPANAEPVAPPAAGGPRPNRRRERPANRRGAGGGGPRNPPGAGNAALPPPGGAPPPRFQATRSTPERNDPLWLAGVGGSELAPSPNVLYIQPGCEVLPTVTNVLHTSFVAASPGYNRRMTEGMLGYYAAVLTWQRLLSLQLQNGLSLRPDEGRYIEQVAARSYSPPALLSHYLAGFGNTRIPNSRDVRFRLVERPAYVRAGNVRGWFGRVSINMQPLYQNYPCLGVYAMRLLENLNQDEHAPVWWDLPEAMRPLIQGALRPSQAMLGYGPRERMTAERLDVLHRAGIYPGEGFPSQNVELPLNLDLLDVIQEELNNISGYKSAPIPTLLLGSQAQLGLVRYMDEMEGLQALSATMETAFHVTQEISFPASAYLYRIKHDVTGVGDGGDVCAPWCVYRYNTAQVGLWAGMIAAGNRLRVSEPQILQWGGFRTNPYLVKAKLEEIQRTLGHG